MLQILFILPTASIKTASLVFLPYFYSLLPETSCMILSIIIVNYNVKHFLEQCLYSVLKAAEHIGSVEVFVVDNNSSDNSMKYLLPKFPTVTFIENKENLGFSKANNVALKQCKGEYVLFLNPDTIVTEDCFSTCLNFFKEHNDCASIGVRMLDGTGKFLPESKRSFPSPLTSFYKLVGLAFLFPKSRIFNQYALGYLDENKHHEVDVLAGAFLMVSKAVIDKVGSFDETFFMYGEDVDLSFRLQQSGLKNYYLGELPIIHFKGESTKRGSLNYVKMFYNAMSIFVSKHYGGSKARVFAMVINCAIWLRAFLSATKRLLSNLFMPLFDLMVLNLVVFITERSWIAIVRHGESFNNFFVGYAAPFFSVTFILVAWVSGIYDNLYKPSKAITALTIATMAEMTLYSLLPDDIRFSRGVFLLAGIFSTIIITFLRGLFIKNKWIDVTNENDRMQQTIIIGAKNEYDEVMAIYEHAGLTERVLGRIAIEEKDTVAAIGHLSQLDLLLNTYEIKEVVFCEGELTNKRIIDIIQHSKHTINFRFHAVNSKSIVGSDNKTTAGESLTADGYYNLFQPYYRRTKRMVDIFIASFMLFIFPLLFLFIKKPIEGIKNMFKVLVGKKTWVGYTLSEKNLPSLRAGILTVYGLPVSEEHPLANEALYKLDNLYAREYDWWRDIQLIFKSFRKLGGV